MKRRDFISRSAQGLCLATGIAAPASPVFGLSDPSAQPDALDPLIPSPKDSSEWPSFIRNLTEWREAQRKTLRYTGSAYDHPATAWAQQNYVCYFLMIYDQDFFDRKTNSYTVDKVLDRGHSHFGGYDSVVLWPGYPRLGLDERNQFDYFRDMPGGLDGLRKALQKFHDRNVKVFVPFNPWDTSTRREPKPDAEVMADIVAAIGADGIFLDTMSAAGPAFSNRMQQFRQSGVILESELALSIDQISDHHASWAQWFNDQHTPGILRNKWFEQRHMQHQIARWNEDHSTELQMAWINGSGMMVWENVFGQWMPWSSRDCSTLKKMSAIQRRYSDILNTGKWTPLVPCILPGVFCSSWEKDGLRIYTLINREQHEVTGTLLNVNAHKGEVFVDTNSGAVVRGKGGTMTLEGTLDARSVLCFVGGAENKFDPTFHKWLSTVRSAVHDMAVEPGMRTKQLLQPTSEERRGKIIRYKELMVEIQATTILLSTHVLSRECGTYESRMPNAIDLNRPIRYERTAVIPHIAIDITPVTNQQFRIFLDNSGYQPAVPHNFLRHWQKGMPPAGREDHPVVWVDLNDARAYATWAGKRLPGEMEWQFAASGYERRVYPWGNEMKDGHCNNGTDETVSVHAFPHAASPFGCLDMCGNTWEWTESEYADAHNRFCWLKGGSHLKVEGSIWYTQSGAQPSSHSIKMLLMYAGLDRSSTIGFRCVADL